jgi:hypothetical protein
MFYTKKYVSFVSIISIAVGFLQITPVYAQNTTANTTGGSVISNCVVTKIGNAPANPSLPPECATVGAGNTDMSRTALALAAAAKPCNNGVINSIGNALCMSANIGTKPDTKVPYPEAAARMTVQAYRTYAPLQCIGFVEVVVAGAYGDRWNLWPDASGMIGLSPYVISNPSIRWTYTKKGSAPPQEGDVPVWNRGTAGHIGIFTKIIDPSRGVVEITDANTDWNGGIKIHNNTTIDSSIVGWEHK